MTVTREECARGAAYKVWQVEDRREEFIRRGIPSPEQLASYIDQVLQRLDTRYIEATQQRVLWVNEAERLVGAINPNSAEKGTVIPCSTPGQQFGAWIVQEQERGLVEIKAQPGPLPERYDPAPGKKSAPVEPVPVAPLPASSEPPQDLAGAELDRLRAKVEARNEAIRRTHEEALARERDWHRDRDR